MKNALRHFANQFVAAWRSLSIIVVGAVAAGIVVLAALITVEPGVLRNWGEFLFLLVPGSLLVALAGAGEGCGAARGKPVFGRFPGSGLADSPNPTLPIDVVTRVGTESLAGLAVLMVFQAAFLLLGFAVAGWGALPVLHVQVLVDITMLPAAAAWLLPVRSRWLQGLLGLAASSTGAAAVAWSISTRSPVPALLTSMGVAIGLLATADAAVRREGSTHREAGRSRHGALARHSRRPLHQLLRDATIRPVENVLRQPHLAGGAALAALLVLFINGVLHGVSGWLVLAAGLWVLLPIVMSPLGLWFFDDQPRWAAHAVLGNSSWAGGSMLPLRREWVARCFYAHGLVAGLLFVGLGLLSARLTGMPLFFGIGIPDKHAAGWLPWLLMVPSFAGMLASSVGGDRKMRLLSLTALVLTPLGYMAGFAFTSPKFQIVAVSNVSRMWLAGAFAVGFALVGGVPPLKYLFPRRAHAGRQP